MNNYGSRDKFTANAKIHGFGELRKFMILGQPDFLYHELSQPIGDVHETFLAEAETEAFWPETEARPRRLSTCPRRDRDRG